MLRPEVGRQRHALDLVPEQPDLCDGSGGLGQLGAIGSGARVRAHRRALAHLVVRREVTRRRDGPASRRLVPDRGEGASAHLGLRSGRSIRCRGSSAGPRTSRSGPRCRPGSSHWSNARAAAPSGLGDQAVDGAAEGRGDPAVTGGQRSGARPIAGRPDRAVVAPAAWDEGEHAEQQHERAESDPTEARHGEDLKTSGVTSPPLSTRVTGESRPGRTADRHGTSVPGAVRSDGGRGCRPFG